MHISTVLAQLPQWVLWRAEGEKRTKVPYTLKGHHASSIKPTTWAPFADALRVYERGGYSGVGFVFSGDDGLVGIDLDDCRNPETGVIDDWAVTILDDLHTYTEVSPSGTGVKAWACGVCAVSVKSDQVEVYGHRRYFTYTGQRLDQYPAEPQEAQAAIDRLILRVRHPERPAPAAASQDEAWARGVLARAIGMVATSTGGHHHETLLKAAKLAGGAMPTLGAEEIERALMAAIWGRHEDEDECRRVIRDGLGYGAAQPLIPPPAPTTAPLVIRDGRPYCPQCGAEVRRSQYPYPGTSEMGWYCPDCKGVMKWPADAVEPTPPPALLRAATALTAKATEYTTAPPTPLAARDLAVKVIPPTRYFIDGMLRAGLALFIGNPGIGKTPALIQLAIGLASGGRWLGALPCRKSRVLYIGVEYDEAYVKEVLLDSTGSPDLPADLFVLTVETFSSPKTAAESIAALHYYLTVFQVDVIIIDVFSGFLPRENFKQDKYRGDYAEFLAYHRLCLDHKALLVGAWHGGKRDKDPETSYNGGQGMWGSAGGGRLTMFYDDEQAVRLRSQLRGHDRREWVLEQARVTTAHFWSVVDSDPDPIFGSDAQRKIYQAVKRFGTLHEPMTPQAVRATLRADSTDEPPPPDAYIRQTLGRLADRGILVKHGAGYVARSKQLGSRGSHGSFGSDGSDGSELVRDAQNLPPDVAQVPIQHGSDLDRGWIGAAPHSDAESGGAIHPIHDFSKIQRSTVDRPDPLEEDDETIAARIEAYRRQQQGGTA